MAIPVTAFGCPHTISSGRSAESWKTGIPFEGIAEPGNHGTHGAGKLRSAPHFSRTCISPRTTARTPEKVFDPEKNRRMISGPIPTGQPMVIPIIVIMDSVPGKIDKAKYGRSLYVRIIFYE
jgi:hypothetical protein